MLDVVFNIACLEVSALLTARQDLIICLFELLCENINLAIH